MMKNSVIVVLCCAVLGITNAQPSKHIEIYKIGTSDVSSDPWLDGPNGLYCGTPENINSHYAGCQGTKDFSLKLLDEKYASGAMPGAQYGKLSPYTKVLTYSGKTLKYIKVEYTFAMGVGSSKLLSGGVGTGSASVLISSPKCGAYGYKIQYYG